MIIHPAMYPLDRSVKFLHSSGYFFFFLSHSHIVSLAAKVAWHFDAYLQLLDTKKWELTSESLLLTDNFLF